ncbi:MULTISPECIES: SpoIIE family protein phosphatase [Kitasatospora]|uniref:PAS domain S-box-containing protein n=2 Tax=Kitasatospora TaxID=2063 RepID=A0ABT1J1D0_9ACTN|nr:SpoIIE family protein phosphatase [Kitasatospora paracochleata]MCP2311226.1 PAS domain S-box-containing protein [Kitasatospora paracochleata]
MDTDKHGRIPRTRRTPAEAEADESVFDGLLTIPIATALISEDGRILHWSPDAEALLGYRPEQAVGRPAAQLLVTDDQRPEVLALFRDILHGRAWSGVFPVRHQQGHHVNLEFRTHPIAGADGRPLVLAVASDVTALRRLQSDLAVLDGFFTQSPVGMAVYDAQLRFVRLNEALARINGLPVDQHLRRRITEVLPGINGQEIEAVMRRVLTEGEAVVDTRSHGRTPGDPTHDHAWSASYFRLQQPDGRILGVSSTIVDITERFQAEITATRAQQRLTMLAEATASIGTTLDLRQTARELADAVVPQLADAVGVFALEHLITGQEEQPGGAPAPDGVTAAGAPHPDGPAASGGHPVAHKVRRLAMATVDPDHPTRHLPTEAVLVLPDDSAYARAMDTARTVTAPNWDLPLLAEGVPAAELNAYLGKQPRPVAITPLVARGTVLGMVVWSRRSDREPIAQADITLGDELAGRAATAIDNARLYTRERNAAEQRRRALAAAETAQERLALLNEASARIGTTLDLATTARELAETATPRLADTVIVEVLDALVRGEPTPSPGQADRSAVLRRLAFHTVPGSGMHPIAPTGSVHRFHPTTPYAWALAHRRPVLLPRTDERAMSWFADDADRARAVREQGVRSLMVIPLIARGAAIGTATFYRSTTDRPYDHADMALASELAARAAVSIDNALLYTRERDAAEQRQRALEAAGAAQERLALLNEASSRIGTTLDLYRTAEELVEVVIPRFADFVTVDLLESVLEGEEPNLVPSTGSVLLRAVAVGEIDDNGTMTHAADPVGGASRSAQLYAQSLRTRRSILVPHVDEAALRRIVAHPSRIEPSLEAGVHSYIMVPLLARGTVLGGAEFIRTRNQEPFTPADVALAEELAARAAVCIDNARLYRRERDTALTLQRSLLPQDVHRTPGLEIAYRYLPSSVISEVGGDWFDVVPLTGGRVALIVGDVMGHGIRAAATMGQLRTVARTLITLDMDPARVLRRLDEATAALGEGQFATCVCVVFDPVDRICTLSSAGHLPPVVSERDGSARLLDPPPGAPLGVGGVPFESMHFELPDDGLLVLYTDGLVERRGHDLDEGLDLLRRTVAERQPTLEGACDVVLTALAADAGQDDVAVIMAHAGPVGGDQLATLTLEGDRAMVRHARRFTRQTLQRWGLTSLGDLAELLTSELITNALVHAGAPVQLRLFRNQLLTVEVSDVDSRLPRLRRAREEDEGGRGMHLINELAHRWGSRSTRDGKVVWFELELPIGTPHG